MILVVGKSGTGKDYLCKEFGLKIVVSHTTRTMRSGEKNGESKWFHKKYKKDKNEIAYTFFNGHHYWATRFDLIDKDAYIIDVDGVKKLQECFGILSFHQGDFTVVYITCAWYKRLYRLIKRDGAIKGIKRFIHDIGKFKGIENFKYTEIKC